MTAKETLRTLAGGCILFVMSSITAQQAAIIYHAFDEQFSSILGKLDELKASGFTHIQVSPIQENTSKGDDGWRAYQPLDYTIDGGKYGNEAVFRDLVSTIHAKGMKVIVDVVFGHVGSLPGADKYKWLEATRKKCEGHPEAYILSEALWKDRVELRSLTNLWLLI